MSRHQRAGRQDSGATQPSRRGALLLAAVLSAGCATTAQDATAQTAQRSPDAAGTLGDAAGGHLILEAVYPGPLEGTVIQRIRDPVTGVLCYLYTPEIVPLSREREGINYGANTIGDISCVVPPEGN